MRIPNLTKWHNKKPSIKTHKAIIDTQPSTRLGSWQISAPGAAESILNGDLNE